MIKSLFAITLLLCFATSVFPGVGGSHGGSTRYSSWSEIKRSTKLRIASPQIYFTSQEQFTVAVDVMEVCVSGDTIRTINARNIYTGTDKTSTSEVLERNHHYFKIQEKNRNSEERYIRAVIPLKYNIDVLAEIKDRDYMVFSKDYTIPECGREGERFE